MPSRWAKTGTRASSCTRPTRFCRRAAQLRQYCRPARPASCQPRRGRCWGQVARCQGQAPPRPARAKNRHEWLVPNVQFRTAAQNDRITGFQAQGSRISRHIGAALVNHTGNAQRHPHAGNIEAGGYLPVGKHCPNRIRQGNNSFNRPRNAFQPRFVQHDAVKARRPDILLFSFGQVVPVGVDNFSRRRPQLIGGRNFWVPLLPCVLSTVLTKR